MMVVVNHLDLAGYQQEGFGGHLLLASWFVVSQRIGNVGALHLMVDRYFVAAAAAATSYTPDPSSLHHAKQLSPVIN